jgi:hypothetical protein
MDRVDIAAALRAWAAPLAGRLHQAAMFQGKTGVQQELRTAVDAFLADLPTAPTPATSNTAKGDPTVTPGRTRAIVRVKGER